MSDKEEGSFEKQISSVIAQVAAKEESAPSSKKARKPYEWTEKRAEAFQKMRDGLALKVEVSHQLKKEKRDSEKKDIKDRIAKIMNSAKRSKSKKEESESEEELTQAAKASDSDSDQDSFLAARKAQHKHKVVAREEPRKSKSSSKRKEKAPVTVPDSESEDNSSSEEESFEVASAKQKQHYRDTKLKIGKAQRSTKALNALDNYILL